MRRSPPALSVLQPEPGLPSRRRVCLGLGVALAWPTACAETDDDSAEPTPGGPAPISMEPYDAGATGDFPIGNFRNLAGQRAAVGRDEGGLWAVDLGCTHLACDIGYDGNVSWAGIECPCHGSRFDRDGRVQRGPAVLDLRNLPVTLDGDRVIVDPAGRVEPGTRTPSA